METYGNEIGQKMRSAVKAKLVELGTGGSSGYIDDELPDYVMIMVANKRSKQQMISDLNLFLGNQTELFVTWLHEVLQKLQEVTLPAASASKKRKSSQKEDPITVTSTKKEKKQAKKDKAPLKKHKEAVASSPDKLPHNQKSSNSLRDVFAEELLIKAKQETDTTAELSQAVKKGNDKETDAPSQHIKESEGFDIPTISEISSTTGSSGKTKGKDSQYVSGNREKDLAELAEIQKKIYVAKKQLRQSGELEDNDEDYDEDFITIRDDESGEAFNEAQVEPPLTPPSQPPKPKRRSPIIFEPESADKSNDHNGSNMTAARSGFTPPLAPAALEERANNVTRNEEPEKPKRPVHMRLGTKQALSDTKRSPRRNSRERRRNLQEKELYVPAFRRKELAREADQSRERESERSILRERGRDRERAYERIADRSREKDLGKVERGRSRVRRSMEDRDKKRTSSEKSHELRSKSQVGKISTTTISSSSDYSPEVNSSRKRIGSRVIVAPVKVIEPSDEEDLSEKPVNSIIMIKPRIPVSPSKQAPKNLLLRAVAEAQKSTILKSQAHGMKPKIISRLGKKVVSDRSEPVYSKSFRERRKSSSNVGVLFTRTARNLIVELNGKVKERIGSRRRAAKEDLYVPETFSDNADTDTELTYMPQSTKARQPQQKDEENWSTASEGSCYEHIDLVDAAEAEVHDQNTQFVVTLNDEKNYAKRKRNDNLSYSRSCTPSSPIPQVSSSSGYCRKREKYAEATSTSATSSSRRHDEPLTAKASDQASPPILVEEQVSTPRSERIELYKKPKIVKKIVINNDSEDDEMSPSKKCSPEKEHRSKRSRCSSREREQKSTTPTPSVGRQKDSLTPSKRKHAPIKFDIEETESNKSPLPQKRRKSSSRDRDAASKDRGRDSRERDRDKSHERREAKRKISIRNAEANKYENIPSTLNSVPVDSSTSYRSNKPKERCKYHPNCTKTFCEYYHPTATCKSFPNCKYADKCIYSHPKCKYDVSCVNLDCNFSHTGNRSTSLLEPTAPPLSSSVVPVQNYKSISSTAITGPVSSTTCKFFPNCTKSACPFYHPKPCRYGKNCINKLECLFYHHETLSSSKFKWVASIN